MLPFDDVGINPVIGKRIENAAMDWLTDNPNKPLDVEEIVRRVERSAKYINSALYLLAAARVLKMTFVPHCHKCGVKIGERYFSAFVIQDELFFCDNCGEIVDREKCEARIEFWRPGTPVDAR